MHKNFSTPCNCPYCNYSINAATSADPDDPDVRPSEDDFTKCFGCGEWLAFKADLTVRKLTDNEYVELMDMGIVKRIDAVYDRVAKQRG